MPGGTLSEDDTKKPKLDASDLKARLGLSKKRAAPPPAPLLPEPATPEPAPAPAGPTAESVDEARRRSEAAAAEAGPAVEEFSVVGHERTPAPSALPGGGVRVEYVSVGAADSYPGQDKKRFLMTALLAVAVGVFAFALGMMLSGASLQNELRDSYILEAKEKSEQFAAQAETVARIDALKGQLKGAMDEVRAVTSDPERDPLELEKTFEALIPVFAKFVEDNVFVSPDAVMGQTMYNGELMREVVAYSIQTVLLYNAVADGLDQLRGYLQMAAPPAATTRGLLVERGSLELPELGEIPVAEGYWIKDQGPPQEIDLIDSATGRSVGKEWQLKLILVDEEEPRQVPTYQVMRLDLSQIYAERTRHAKLVSVERLAEIVEKLDRIAARINAAPLLAKIQEWATKE